MVNLLSTVYVLQYKLNKLFIYYVSDVQIQPASLVYIIGFDLENYEMKS